MLTIRARESPDDADGGGFRLRRAMQVEAFQRVVRAAGGVEPCVPSLD